MKSNDLLNEFTPITDKAWKQKLQVELSGKDYNQTLIWKNLEDINIKPFYSRESQPFTYNIATPKDWKSCYTIFVLNPSKTKEIALKAINLGAQSLHLTISTTTNSVYTLLTELNELGVTLFLSFTFLDSTFIKKITTLSNLKNCYILTDSIGHLSETGNWYHSFAEDFQAIENILQHSQNATTPILSINSGLYQNAGANITQQLAYSLAHANEYLNTFSSYLKTNTITFTVAIGNNFFFEIAKLRALRLLYKTIACEYNLPDTCYILTTSSKRNKTLYNHNTNALRITAENTSAILGGANAITALSSDFLFNKPNNKSMQEALSLIKILKNEGFSEIDKNSANDSYFIDFLTEQLANNALSLFKEIEASGGFLTQLKKGIIQKKIKESAIKELIFFNNKKLVLLGNNKYVNFESDITPKLMLYPFVKHNPRKTLITPIIPNRITETLDKKKNK